MNHAFQENPGAPQTAAARVTSRVATAASTKESMSLHVEPQGAAAVHFQGHNWSGYSAAACSWAKADWTVVVSSR
jgi:hypothetical protein